MDTMQICHRSALGDVGGSLGHNKPKSHSGPEPEVDAGFLVWHRLSCSEKAASTGAILASAVDLDVLSNASPVRDRELVFYTHMLCPYAQRVLLTLLEKGADFETVHIDLSSKPGWYSAVNPRGLVPAIEFSATGRVEVESIDLCRVLNAELPGPALSPEAG
eukprot:jgi/Tetstr1/434243/TSEL_023353.t1